MASLLLHMFCLWHVIASATSAQWFVRHSGGREATCGTSLENACADLEQTIKKAQDGDVILVSSSPEIYRLCETESSSVFERSVQVTGVVMAGEERPRVGCDSMDENQVIIKFSSSSSSGVLTFVEVILSNGAILMGNGSLNLSFVTFENATVVSLDGCMELTLNAEQTTWNNKALCNQNNGNCIGNTIKCSSLGVRMIGCKLKVSPFSIHSSTQINVYIEGTVFDGGNSTINGLDVTTSGEGEVEVKQSSFSHFVSPSLFIYITNLYEGSLKVRRVNSLGYFYLILSRNTFQDNERAITLIGQFTATLIKACTFERNTAMHSGAAILSLVENNTKTSIFDSIFRANKGGKIRRIFRIKETQDHVRIQGNTISLNTTEARGSIEAIGRGGAIRLQKGIMEIIDSQFYDNTANIQGGSIMSDIKTNLRLNNVLIHGPQSGYQPLRGDSLYSRGFTALHNVHFVAYKGKPGLSIMEHVGGHWSMSINVITVECPIGYNLRTHKLSAFSVTSIGIHSSSHQFDELSYDCEPCPYGQYSLDHGSVKNTLVPSTSIYLSFALGSHEAVKPDFSGEYALHEIKCVGCPRGDLTDEKRQKQMTDENEAQSALPDSVIMLCPAFSDACQNMCIASLIVTILIAMFDMY